MVEKYKHLTISEMSKLFATHKDKEKKHTYLALKKKETVPVYQNDLQKLQN